MTIAVRTIRADELQAFIEALTTGFNERVDVPRIAEEMGSIWDLERTLAAFDGDRICGTFRSWPTELTLPGGARLPAAAIAAVSVMPTHRRRGILRSMVAVAHAAIRERDEAFGLLYSSEYPIYGRFGYGPATLQATWTLDTAATTFHGEPSSGIELASPSEALRDDLKTMFDEACRSQPGAIRRRDVTWDYDLGLRTGGWGEDWKGFVAVQRGEAGVVEGFVRYRIEGGWEHHQPHGVLKVDDLHAVGPEAEASLWRFIAGLDWIATVEAPRRSPVERLPWLLTNARAARVSDVGDALWVRIVDLRRALEARSYPSEASIVLEVVDGDAAGGRSRVHLDVGGGGATSRETTRSPDLTIDASALGAAYLGGTGLSDAAMATGADEHRAGALQQLEALLRTPDPPWCSTFF